MSVIRTIISGGAISTISTDGPGNYVVSLILESKTVETHDITHFEDAMTMADQVLGENIYDKEEDL